MTRTVADNAAMLQVIAGHDGMDPACPDEPVPDYSTVLGQDIRGLRVGVPRDYFFEDLAPEVERAVEVALAQLEALGARLVEVEVPHARYAGSAGWLIAMAEGACYHETRLRETPELFDPLIRERMEAAKFYMATDYIKAMRIRSILVAEMKDVFSRCDVMAVPGAGSVAGMIQPPERARTDVTDAPPPPFRGGTTFLGNMTGLPAMTIPCGFSGGAKPLPIAIQFYGRPFDEAAIYRVGHAYEQATDWHRRRAPV